MEKNLDIVIIGYNELPFEDDVLNEVSRHNLLSWHIPNLAAVYLTNFLLRRGVRADFVNLFQQEKEKLREMLLQRPLCVAITTTFYVTNLPVINMVQFIRECAPEIPIVIGGVLVSNHFNIYTGEDFLNALEDM